MFLGCSVVALVIFLVYIDIALKLNRIADTLDKIADDGGSNDEPDRKSIPIGDLPDVVTKKGKLLSFKREA